MTNNLTVCIPIYNTRHEFLIKIFEDLTKQTYKSFDILVQDDASTTTYDHIYSSYSAKLNLRIIKNQNNVGMVNNWNKAISSVLTKYFIILGHDDGLTPDALEKLVTPLERDEQIIASSCSCHYIDLDGNIINANHNINHRDNIFIKSNIYVIEAKDAVALCLNNGIALGELTCQMFRTDHNYKYDSQFQHAADLDYFLSRLINSSACKVSYNTDKLLYRRLHKQALTENNYLNGYVSLDRERIFNKFHHSYEFTKLEINYFRAFLLACAFMDLIRFPKHRSTRLARIALSQIRRNTRFHLLPYARILYSIVFHTNLDSR